MDEKDLKFLIESFMGYRELLTPISENLSSFIETYDTIKDDIERLNETINGEASENLQKIYKSLAAQADKAGDLSSKIEQFMQTSNKYINGVNASIDYFARLEKQLKSINEVEQKANEQLAKLDVILEDKRKSYNVRDLEKALENYNQNVQRVGEFINRDIASALYENKEKMQTIKDGNDKLTELVQNENKNMETLIEEYRAGSKFLSNIVEKNAVNEEYLFDILDKWAISRKVKARK